MISVAIVEDEEEIRLGIQRFLNRQKDFLCEVAVESVEDFLPHLNDESLPDVILMDIGLPGMSGIDGIKMIKEKHPEINIIMLTVYNDPHRIFDSLCAGASGYLLKNTPFEQIKEAIKEVYDGGAPMSKQIARKVIDFFTPGRTPNEFLAQPSPQKTESPLTDKEKQVVVGLVDGLSYKMIADRMNISIETIRFHIKNVYEKLHVHSKGEVIAKSLRGEI
ncbi:MAG: response regulator transcription factor [Ignavibacteriae bacterium]|nr:response regulator transcription factor [Ignavibacteriota bacterium]